MEFKEIKLEDKELINEYIKQIENNDSGISFATIFLWQKHYQIQYAIVEDMLVFKAFFDGHVSFSYPIGKKAITDTVHALFDYCEEHDLTLRFHNMPPYGETELEKEFPGQFDISYDRDVADYVYLREKLETLSGKKYHGKRNHINKFKENHTWSYEEINDQNKEECKQMLIQWKKDNCEPGNVEKHSEICVSENSLNYMKELGYYGGAIRCDGKIIAFSIGEPLSDNMFVVHIEKADSQIQGAYPIINQQFVEHLPKQYEYINREEDCGEEGLRKAKLSYRPVMMVEKGSAVCREEAALSKNEMDCMRKGA